MVRKNKKHLNITNTIVFDDFKPDLDITDVVVPDQKKRAIFKATFDGQEYNGQQIVPFDILRGTIRGGFNASLASAGLPDVDFTGMHRDVVAPGPSINNNPLQGPFTKRYVGGRQARHVAPFRTASRKEEYTLSIASATGTISPIITGDIPTGRYLRGFGAKRPVNIANIKTEVTGHSTNLGVRQIGNYQLNYEVVMGNSRLETNMDFVFNSSSYDYSMPTAFLTSIEMRGNERTGSADYPAPRQRSGRRINKSIIVNTFAAPGSKLDSKQLFRDVNSDQLSPNNALPFRNIPVRQTYHNRLSIPMVFGGYELGNPTTPSVHKTAGNQTQRLEISGVTSYATGTVRDNGYVNRPVPAGDSTQWFFSISGSNTALYSEYVLSGNRYPGDISVPVTTFDSAPAFGTAIYSDTAGKSRFIWGSDPQVSPWTQLRKGNTNQGSYFTRRNVYELEPIDQFIFNPPSPPTEERLADGTSIRTTTDRAGNTLKYYYSKRFTEAPVTSRYKPFRHRIVTPLGTPNKTSAEDVTVDMKYSYGNSIMGFANRDLNRLIQGDRKFAYGEEKRPYEILRDQRVANVPSYINGVKQIAAFEYSETIYPQEVFTYLSETRQRYVYKNDFWKNDKTVSLTEVASYPLASYVTLRNSAAVQAYNAMMPRVSGNFVTSQGFAVEAQDQLPYNSLDSSYPQGTGPGSASIWPMDSYLFSDWNSTLVGLLTASVPVIFADASTMAAGELMMTHYGSINDQITNSSFAATPGTAIYQTSSVNSAQYVYNVPVAIESTSTTPAVAATAAITASKFEGQANATATGSIEFGTLADGDTVNGSKVEIPDGTNTFVFTFDNLSTGFSYTAPIDYTVGTSDGSGGVISGADLRNALFDAIDDANSTPSTPLDIADPAKSGDYVIDITAGTAGSGFNSNTITTDAGAGSSGIEVDGFGGGSDYSLNGLTLVLEDETQTDTYTFDNTVTVASSNATIIGCQDATSTVLVATAIYTSINAAQSGGDIDITPTDPAGSTDIVILTADNAGTGMNGKTIVGTFITDLANYGESQPFAGGEASVITTAFLPEVRSPGSAYTRPPWTAARNRMFVDGPSKGTSAGAAYPAYNTYDDYAKQIRLVGKDYTIVPEFRISEHIEQYQSSGPLVAAISATLAITGANNNNNSGVNTEFYNRYAMTDNIEFLSDLMPQDTENRNYIFNNYPRHFEISSNAIAKLLPYDGFYPVDRSLDIAKKFYESFSSQAIYEGDDSSTTQAWRSIYKPFFAPGIMYNSIKSGVAVDYPVRRANRNEGQFLSSSASDPLHGALSGTLSSAVSDGNLPGNRRRPVNNLDWTNADVNKFFWADKLPFESIMDPASFMEQGFDKPLVLSDLNEYLFNDVSGSIVTKGLDDSLYKKMVSNFLANVPRFFLKEKNHKFADPGFMTKFVSQFGSPPKNSQEITNPARTVQVDNKSAYMMEIGLMKTDDFNLYSNPYAFGIPTATGSVDWSAVPANQVPSGTTWPKHRGEFAPFTPPYYYGPSLVRLLFVPSSNQTEYTLDQIINNEEGELFVQYLNESGSYYDAVSGSYIDRDGNIVTTTGTPAYGWNRAWQNRMDLDASISIGNKFPLGAGGSYISTDPNRWTIMPKWECPILDFPDRSSGSPKYDFSSSIAVAEYTSSAQGMWHQYGTMPNHNQGVYMYIKDIPTGEDEEYDRVAVAETDGSATSINYSFVKKVPKFIVDSGRQVKSLADLCGFDPDEIIRKGFDRTKAKRLGELAEDGEKNLSEAILALPVYEDDKGNMRIVTMRAPADSLGPKIKEFRKKFTKYSLPPVLAEQLQGMVPPGYPTISELINPFGTDDYDKILRGSKITQVPVVYLMEHSIQMSRQDLADIWQGILPEVGRSFRKSFSAIDHYMPGDDVEESITQFPEVLKKQIELNVDRTGHPRYDLLDVAIPGTKDGLFPEIKWLVFKVKERGLLDYSHMIMEEIDGPAALGFDNLRGFLSRSGLSEEQLESLDQLKDTFAKNSYLLKHGIKNPTYNWPYDYFSLLELAKIDTKIGFRPDLRDEYSEVLGSSNTDEET